MENTVAKVGYEKEIILSDLIRILTEMMEDWDVNFSGRISGEVFLIADLGLQSIDIVMLTGEIHRLYGRRDLPFERVLLSGGHPVEDLRLSTLVDFLHTQLTL